jgi:hypothetical protein
MNLNELKKNWDQFGRDDPYWAILTHPDVKGNKWVEEAFFETGRRRIDRKVQVLKRLISNFDFHSALDFGCREGRLTQGLANHFETVSENIIRLVKTGIVTLILSAKIPILSNC